MLVCVIGIQRQIQTFNAIGMATHLIDGVNHSR